MSKSLIFILIMLTSLSVSSGTYTGKVEKINLHGDGWGTYNPNDLGVLSLHLIGMPKACGKEDGLNRVVITSDHVLFQSVVSVALAAKLSDKNVTINYLDSCNIRSGAWDFGFISISE
ncbi:hypothetical protein SAMN02745866_01668 [Alteromonadaceae bacterium Bs31]|nr:hypothetical protein SAMN02745866_01668 [Alteromonadaceae bacterium Bs31]